MTREIGRLIRDESGQDLIEYALLTTLIGLVGILGINAFKSAINSTYTSWNTSVNSLWVSPDPS
jgi:Flp pilus assembly pilin Flp